MSAKRHLNISLVQMRITTSRIKCNTKPLNVITIIKKYFSSNKLQVALLAVPCRIPNEFAHVVYWDMRAMF